MPKMDAYFNWKKTKHLKKKKKKLRKNKTIFFKNYTIVELTVGILDLDAAGSHGRLAHARLVLRKHAELVSPVLDEVGDVDHVGDAGVEVDAAPVVCAVLPLLDPVAGDAAAAVRLGFLPGEGDEVPAHLRHLGHAWGVRSVWRRKENRDGFIDALSAVICCSHPLICMCVGDSSNLTTWARTRAILFPLGEELGCGDGRGSPHTLLLLFIAFI